MKHLFFVIIILFVNICHARTDGSDVGAGDPGACDNDDINCRTVKSYKLSSEKVDEYTKEAAEGSGKAAYRLYFYYDTFVRDCDKSEYYHDLAMKLNYPMAFYNEAIMIIDEGGYPHMAKGRADIAFSAGVKDTENIMAEIIAKEKELEKTIREREKMHINNSQPDEGNVVLIINFGSDKWGMLDYKNTSRRRMGTGDHDIDIFCDLLSNDSYVYSKERTRQYIERAARGDGAAAYKLFLHYGVAIAGAFDEARHYYDLAISLEYPAALYNESMAIMYKNGDLEKARKYLEIALANGEEDKCNLMEYINMVTKKNKPE